MKSGSSKFHLHGQNDHSEKANTDSDNRSTKSGTKEAPRATADDTISEGGKLDNTMLTGENQSTSESSSISDDSDEADDTVNTVANGELAHATNDRNRAQLPNNTAHVNGNNNDALAISRLSRTSVTQALTISSRRLKYVDPPWHKNHLDERPRTFPLQLDTGLTYRECVQYLLLACRPLLQLLDDHRHIAFKGDMYRDVHGIRFVNQLRNLATAYWSGWRDTAPEKKLSAVREGRLEEYYTGVWERVREYWEKPVNHIDEVAQFLDWLLERLRHDLSIYDQVQKYDDNHITTSFDYSFGLPKVGHLFIRKVCQCDDRNTGLPQRAGKSMVGPQTFVHNINVPPGVHQFQELVKASLMEASPGPYCASCATQSRAGQATRILTLPAVFFLHLDYGKGAWKVKARPISDFEDSDTEDSPTEADYETTNEVGQVSSIPQYLDLTSICHDASQAGVYKLVSSTTKMRKEFCGEAQYEARVQRLQHEWVISQEYLKPSRVFNETTGGPSEQAGRGKVNLLAYVWQPAAPADVNVIKIDDGLGNLPLSHEASQCMKDLARWRSLGVVQSCGPVNGKVLPNNHVKPVGTACGSAFVAVPAIISQAPAAKLPTTTVHMQTQTVPVTTAHAQTQTQETIAPAARSEEPPRAYLGTTETNSAPAATTDTQVGPTSMRAARTDEEAASEAEDGVADEFDSMSVQELAEWLKKEHVLQALRKKADNLRSLCRDVQNRNAPYSVYLKGRLEVLAVERKLKTEKEAAKMKKAELMKLLEDANKSSNPTQSTKQPNRKSDQQPGIGRVTRSGSAAGAQTTTQQGEHEAQRLAQSNAQLRDQLANMRGQLEDAEKQLLNAKGSLEDIKKHSKKRLRDQQPAEDESCSIKCKRVRLHIGTLQTLYKRNDQDGDCLDHPMVDENDREQKDYVDVEIRDESAENGSPGALHSFRIPIAYSTGSTHDDNPRTESPSSSARLPSQSPRDFTPPFPPQSHLDEFNSTRQGTDSYLAPSDSMQPPFLPTSNHNATWVASIPQDQASAFLESRDKGVVVISGEDPITEKDIFRHVNRYLPTIEDIERQQIRIEMRQPGSIPPTTNVYKYFEQTYNEVLHVRQLRRDTPDVAEAAIRAELANLRKEQNSIIQDGDSSDEDGVFTYG
ncbi:hypothetical protein H2198_002848 [Neophaeococcomyces mojaviensis]|uniref:Uncharacterized protein n=1 Tax=Neophaeococcomyces mojaviensis TaxID=3383035 RepID=A0ACC3AD21_9EURO|nr:hypothetical protein H2198_002848 [Knufia sp. JES_112]